MFIAQYFISLNDNKRKKNSKNWKTFLENQKEKPMKKYYQYFHNKIFGA